jgi:hypothetical protein
MVNTTERDRELVADLATERTRLRRTKMMGIRGLTPADQAGLRGNKLTMRSVADAARFADRQHALVDAAPGRPRWALDGFPKPVSDPPIAECRELCAEACFDKLGVGGHQRILGGQASMGPARRPIGGLKRAEFGDQPISQCGGLIIR